jgi:hypothetical protein
MTKRKGKTVSFDAMVKFFIHNYNIPTKRDIDRLNERLDRLEKLVRALPQRSRRTAIDDNGAAPKSATETVLDLIRRNKSGISIAQIREQTGYDDKKLRNIIFRLNKMDKINRVNRGIYETAE